MTDDTTNRSHVDGRLAQIMQELPIASDYLVAPALSDLTAMVPGDVNGDGRDDLLIGNPRFLSINANGQTPLPNVGRVYLLLGGGSASAVNLANSPYIWEAFGLGAGVYEVGVETGITIWKKIRFARSVYLQISGCCC